MGIIHYRNETVWKQRVEKGMDGRHTEKEAKNFHKAKNFHEGRRGQSDKAFQRMELIV